MVKGKNGKDRVKDQEKNEKKKKKEPLYARVNYMTRGRAPIKFVQ